MKIRFLLLATISGFIIALDQLTKMYIHTQFRLGESRNVIAGLFDLTYIRNPGAAFGIFSTAHAGFRGPFFMMIPVIAVCFILYVLWKTPDSDRLQTFALSLVFGGAIGNYIDRIRFGYVIDFLLFYYPKDVTILGRHYRGPLEWPAFNVADSAIVCGITILLALISLKKEVKKASS